MLLALALTACAGARPVSAASSVRPSRAAPSASPAPVPTPSQALATATPDPATRLSGGAATLPAVAAGVPFVGHLLIADTGNKRIVEIAPSGEMTWSFPPASDAAAGALGPWDDAHYAPDGTSVSANSAVTNTVISIDLARRAVRWQAGTPNRPGRGTTMFSSPDDAVTALDGTTYFADILNCRVVQLSVAGAFLRAYGDGVCRHDPPASFASPNGAYPTADGDLIVTEITGSWISRMAVDGTLRWAVRAPVSYPSDAMAYPDGSVLVTDYVTPGRVIRLAPDGTVLWRYDAAGQLHNPSSAVPLASNRVAISDDFGNRVLIVDPTTDQIVREYTTVGGIRLHTTDCVSFRPD